MLMSATLALLWWAWAETYCTRHFRDMCQWALNLCIYLWLVGRKKCPFTIFIWIFESHHYLPQQMKYSHKDAVICSHQKRFTCLCDPCLSIEGTTCVFSCGRTSCRAAFPVPLSPWPCWAPTPCSQSWESMTLRCTAQNMLKTWKWSRVRPRSWKTRWWSCTVHTGQNTASVEILWKMRSSFLLEQKCQYHKF